MTPCGTVFMGEGQNYSWEKFRNFDEMTKEQLEAIAKREVCESLQDDSAELEHLTDTKQYEAWRIKFHRYCTR